MQKYVLMLMVFSLALFATSGAHSQDRIEADPSNVHKESPAKMGLDVPISSNDDTWTNGGPFGGYVTCLAIAPSNSNVIYAGTPGGIYEERP